jgi:spermidine synthase
VFSALNSHSLQSPKVRVINDDAFPWLEKSEDMFDFVVVDFPDPTNYSLGKLYTAAFYRSLRRHVARNGAVVVQSTSPLFARKSFWCIVETMNLAGFRTYPYHVYVPSFGEWGFVLASFVPYAPPSSVPPGLRFLNGGGMPELFKFPRDMEKVEAEPNRLNDQVLVRYYEQEWREYSR